MRVRVAIVGGGLQGCAVALELSLRGVSVDLYERAGRLLQGASRHSEGKIHLGYVYAADTTMRTSRLMATGAAAFVPALRRWLGPAVEDLAFSTPFHYAVHRTSLISAAELGARYEVISSAVDEAFRNHPFVEPAEIAGLRRLEPDERAYYTADIIDGFATAETAVDTDSLADTVEQAVLTHHSIRAHLRSRIARVDIRRKRLSIVDVDGSVHESCAYDHIVNCSWDGLPGLDATASVFSERPWSYRVKYFVRVPAADDVLELRSTTFVLGQFGDVVDFGSCGSYLSWYPAGRTAFATGLFAPAWNSTPTALEAATIRRGIIEGLSTVIPAVATESAVRHGAVRGGLILAHGHTDLDDETTELHQRHSIGPTSSAGYHSVNTGKMTMAPYFAMQVADRIRPAP
jgi:glycine/D-amino acid oxidase-like deaminating enzyme